MLRHSILCLLSVALGVALALVVGGFLGFSTNPDKTAAFNAAHREMALAGVSGTLEELQKQQYELAQKHAGFNSTPPPVVIAILKSHPLLPGAFALVLLCIFRPSVRAITVVFLPAVATAYVLINFSAAASLFAAAALASIWSFAYVRIKKTAP